jgi:NADH:ubiquinone oxidoreductase subunit 5 (subunit L)/multisubunit Na+/H+ antiporter MnhA subunit
MLTTLLGSSMMLVQSDIKKTLGYSTIGQMGFMMMECGLGAYGLAIFHLIAHGWFKGSIFLNCGYVIHSARQEPRFPPKNEPPADSPFSILTWLTGFLTTLILPLIIVLAAHGILNIPLRDSQGTTIFLFFGWATSSQAILTIYRVRAAASWKVAASMLCALFVIVLTYLLAAESFTHFLFPGPGEVASHFKMGALPVAVFDVLVSAFALCIILGWLLIYARSHGRKIRMPGWADVLQLRLYLFLLNRLYFDAVSMRLGRCLTDTIRWLDTSTGFSFFAGVIALGAAVNVTPQMGNFLAPKIALLLLVALFLPLFPLHGMYLAALTRAPAYLTVFMAVVLPAAGLYGLASLVPELSPDSLRAVRVLSVFGALYGSFKALAAVRTPQLLAYAGLAFFSALWWRVAVVGALTVYAVVYAVAVILLISGLLFVWLQAECRCGNLTLDRMHGLARTMPRFATIVSLLTMAAVGLPPFGLFSAYIAMLLEPTGAASWDLVAILAAWFLASWYLFRMMQRLLFGRQRTDFRYEDLRIGEVAAVTCLLAVLVLLGALPASFESVFTSAGSLSMESRLWPR